MYNWLISQLDDSGCWLSAHSPSLSLWQWNKFRWGRWQWWLVSRMITMMTGIEDDKIKISILIKTIIIIWTSTYQSKHQEYQRAVIFRLGRVKKGGAVGPGHKYALSLLAMIMSKLVMLLTTVTFNLVWPLTTYISLNMVVLWQWWQWSW